MHNLNKYYRNLVLKTEMLICRIIRAFRVFDSAVLYITAANLHFLIDFNFENSFGILYDGVIRLPNFKSFQSETAEIKIFK